MENKTISFIGGGRITKIFLQAFANSNIKFKDIVVFDNNSDVFAKLQNEFKYIKTENSNIETAAKCDVIFLAIHPPIIPGTLKQIKPLLNDKSIIVSLAPKITIDRMINILGGFDSIARVNPCATAVINQGINPVSFSKNIENDNKELLFNILNILGKTFEVEEEKIEAYAVISAMGPTYFWFQFQHLKELALKFGFEENEAKEIISEMINGAINTLFSPNIKTEDVMDLIPVKPIGEYEDIIKSYYDEKLNIIYNKIKP